MAYSHFDFIHSKIGLKNLISIIELLICILFNYLILTGYFYILRLKIVIGFYPKFLCNKFLDKN